MAKSLESIDETYRDASERATAWKETDPERAQKLLSDAEVARAAGYRAYAEDQSSIARAATLSAAKGSLVAKYPLADPAAITGDSPEAMEAAAKASHEFIDTRVKAAQEQSRAARRVTQRENWTGTRGDGKVGLPGGESVQQQTLTEEERTSAYNNTAEIIANSKLPGHLRRYREGNPQAVPAAGNPEDAAWSDYKKLHPNSGLSFEAFRDRNAGIATFTEQNSNGVPDSEDRKG